MTVSVTRDPHRQLSKACSSCREDATCWLIVGDDNQRIVVSFCDACAQSGSAALRDASVPTSLEEKITAVDVRYAPRGQLMFRIPADDEERGMVEGLCFSCQAKTAEWRTRPGPDWQACDDCADMGPQE